MARVWCGGVTGSRVWYVVCVAGALCCVDGASAWMTAVGYCLCITRYGSTVARDIEFLTAGVSGVMRRNGPWRCCQGHVRVRKMPLLPLLRCSSRDTSCSTDGLGWSQALVVLYDAVERLQSDSSSSAWKYQAKISLAALRGTIEHRKPKSASDTLSLPLVQP